MTYSSSRLTVPDGFPELLQGLAREVLRNQPTDIIAFACEHFNRLASDRESNTKINQAISNINETTVLTGNKDAIIPEKPEGEEQQPLETFDDKDVKAVIKIQSNIRGMQARKEVNALKEKKEQEEQEAAAVKIQANFKGMQARKEVDKIKEDRLQEQPTEKKEDEELPDLNSFEQEDIDKITKLQAGFRGITARKNMNKLKVDDTTTKQESPEPTENAKTSPEQELEEAEKIEFEGTEEEINAATKIQAQFRGMKVRNEPKERPVTEAEQIEIPETPHAEVLDLRPETAQTLAENVEIPQTPKVPEE